MKRNYGLDLLRIFLCLCVITTHSYHFFELENWYIAKVFNSFIFQADAMFFMLSGYFNLEKEFKNKKDIIKFYKNKLITAFIPFLAVVFILLAWDYFKIEKNTYILGIFKVYFESIVDTSALGHMWFLYILFGLLLSTPFLSKMLHNMDEKELTLLWYIGIGWNVVSIYLCNNLGFNFRFGAWMLDDWMLYYFAGYYYRRVISNQSKVKWTILGIGGFVLTMIGIFFLPTFNAATTSSPLFTLFCMGCLMFWDKTFNIKSEKLQKIILFLSKNTYLVYLYHMYAIGFVFRRLANSGTSFSIGILLVLLTFIVAIILSVITNLCLKPVQKLIDKAWKIQ